MAQEVTPPAPEEETVNETVQTKPKTTTEPFKPTTPDDSKKDLVDEPDDESTTKEPANSEPEAPPVDPATLTGSPSPVTGAEVDRVVVNQELSKILNDVEGIMAKATRVLGAFDYSELTKHLEAARDFAAREIGLQKNGNGWVSADYQPTTKA